MRYYRIECRVCTAAVRDLLPLQEVAALQPMDWPVHLAWLPAKNSEDAAPAEPNRLAMLVKPAAAVTLLRRAANNTLCNSTRPSINVQMIGSSETLRLCQEHSKPCA